MKTKTELKLEDFNISFFKLLLCIIFISSNSFSFGQDFIIPVVVHNVHSNNTGILTEEQIIDMIDDLNSYYAQFGNPSNFNNPLDIEFRLAKVDPQGYCTNGINDVHSAQPIGSIDIPAIDLSLKNNTRWPSNKYLNIWTVVDIDAGAAGGYAFTPTSVIFDQNPIQFLVLNPENQNSNEAILDGVVIVYNEPIEYLAHEVGHWLNLFHINGPDKFDTSSFWFGCHTNAECEDQGDFVCDTPPVDRQAFTSGCSGQNSCNLDSPDLNDDHSNLMTFEAGCITPQSNLTNGQLVRMTECLTEIRTTLWSSANLIETGVLSTIGSEVIVNSTETWTTGNLPNGGDITINGSLIIENDANLTIDPGVTVRFCAGGRVVVRPGSNLILRGTLTSVGEEKWEGIELQGSTSPNQTNTARFQSFSPAEISNATIGIRNYGPAYTDSGCWVQASGTNFTDNDISIDIGPNQSAILLHALNSTFTNNDNPDFLSFIKLNRARGAIGVTSCNFIGNATGSCIEDHGIGILAENSIFGVYLNSNFEKLGYGVRVESATGSSPFFVENNHFTGCYIGVYSNGTGNFRIWENIFDMLSVPEFSIMACTGQDESIDDQVAIFLENNMVGADIQENMFMNATTLNSIAISAIDIGPINNKVRANSFSTQWGIYGEGENSTALDPSVFFAINLTRGLFFTCNDFFTSKKGVFGNDEGGQLSMRNIQFNQNSSHEFVSAANRWLTPSDDDIDNQASGTNSEVVYFYNEDSGFEQPQNTVNVMLENKSPFVCQSEVDPPGQTGGQNNGVLTSNDVPGYPFIDPNTLPTLVSIHPTLQTGIDNILTNLSNNSNPTSSELELAQLNLAALYEQDDQLLSDIIALYQMHDNLWDESQYLYYLSEYNSYVGDLIAIKYLCGTGQWPVATTILNDIPTRFNLTPSQQADYNMVVALFDKIKNVRVEDYDQSMVQDVILFAEGDDGNAKGWARALLTYHGYYYVPTIDINTVRGRESSPESKTIERAKHLAITPNPASNIISVSMKGNQEVLLNYQIISLDGKVIVNGNDNLHKIDISDLGKGIYFLKVTTVEGNIITDKFLKF